ncbi:phage integrase SAM-like domain-containing protein, partial [Klebsiella pneumoniae]|uniref:phage integrase SAM-like domain-containing protein n=13 Tax=Enterobacteriaceae TaxID=543 RepID=UPI0039C4784C
KFTGADITPSMVTHHEVLRWRRYVLREKQQSAQTWNNKIAHLRALYNYAMESGLLPAGKNPFNNCTVQRDRKKKRTLNRSQLTRL